MKTETFSNIHNKGNLMQGSGSIGDKGAQKPARE